MFGRGVYFADSVSKALQYCDWNESDGVGLLLLCDVALGSSFVCYEPNNLNREAIGNHQSVKGIGKKEPAKFVNLDGILLASAEFLVTSNAPLEYNEFIVYDTNQIKIKYLIEFKIDKIHNEDIDNTKKY